MLLEAITSNGYTEILGERPQHRTATSAKRKPQDNVTVSINQSKGNIMPTNENWTALRVRPATHKKIRILHAKYMARTEDMIELCEFTEKLLAYAIEQERKEKVVKPDF